MARTLAQLTGLWNEKDRKKRKKGEAVRLGSVWEKREKEKETHGHWGSQGRPLGRRESLLGS